MTYSESQKVDAFQRSLSALVEGRALAVGTLRGGQIVNSSPRLDDLLAAGAPIGERSFIDFVAEAHRDRVREVLAAFPKPGDGPNRAPGSEPAEPRPAEPKPATPGDTELTGRTALVFDALRADGSIFEAELLLAPVELGDGPALALLLEDITERRRAEKQLSYMAYLDPLTGLANRALFLDRLRESLVTARRDRRVIGVLMCDLDGFKAVNDTYGHDAGDLVLLEVARRLEGTTRESDTVARLGGDEFAVILGRLARREDASIIAERMIDALEAPIDLGAARCKVGVSIGIATYPRDARELDALLARADAAMYDSKRAGKNRFTFTATADVNVAPAPLPFIRWSEVHAVGHAVIDAQHRRMVELLNQLGDDLKACRDRDTILTSLGALVSFTRKHFATEERLMSQHAGAPGEARHLQDHRKLLDDLTALTVTVDVSSMMMTMRFLQEWLIRHIDNLDKPLGAWLRERGAT